MRSITPREREVLRLRFEEDLTQAEIGEIIGVSQMQVSRLIRQAVARLRLAARTDPAAEPVARRPR
jgi:RNA polymerase sigma-B factor